MPHGAGGNAYEARVDASRAADRLQVDPVAPVGLVPPDRHRLLLPFCTAFLIADVAAAVIALAVHDHDSGSTAAGAPSASSSTASLARPASPLQSAAADARSLALTWMSGAVPHSAVVLADATTTAQLARYGFAHAGTSTHAAYTVSTPALRRTAATDGAIATVLQQAVPIAVFPTDAGQIVVGAVSDVAPSTLAEHRSDDAQLRTGAGRGLLANPNFVASPAASSVLSAGRLDLRPATVLALMAAEGKVQLRSVTSVAAETAAGLPARTVTFVATPAAEQRALLLGLSQAYRPLTWTHQPDGSYTATWSIRPDPDDTQR
jgi:hypothetical protein